MMVAGDMTLAQRPLHALNRLAFGPRPGDIEELRRSGVDSYIARQLDPTSIPEPPELSDRIGSLRTLRMTPVELFLEFQQPIRQAAKGDTDAKKAARHEARQVIMEAVEARVVRAVFGVRHLQEVMTAFWFNHFNVFAGKGLCSIWTGAFEEEAIRPHTMGRFRDLLGATAQHPAMLFYLDNWQNTAPGSSGKHGKFDGINENYARELMELHTLGVNGGYTQNDVIALAHILTGWGLQKRGGQMGPGQMDGAQMRARQNFSARDFQPHPRGLFGLFGFRRMRALDQARGAACEWNREPVRLPVRLVAARFCCADFPRSVHPGGRNRSGRGRSRSARAKPRHGQPSVLPARAIFRRRRPSTGAGQAHGASLHGHRRSHPRSPGADVRKR